MGSASRAGGAFDAALEDHERRWPVLMAAHLTEIYADYRRDQLAGKPEGFDFLTDLRPRNTLGRQLIGQLLDAGWTPPPSDSDDR